MAFFKKQRRPTPFNVTPMYWDPQKEEREERERRVRAELGLDKEEGKENLGSYAPSIKGKFRSAAHGDREMLKMEKRKSQRKLLFFIAIAVVIIYFLYTGLPVIQQFLENFANN